MIRAFAISLLLLLAACGPSSSMPTCNSNNCSGCCTPTGACLDGKTKASCGSGGQVCSTCKDTDYCVAGECSNAPACKYVNADCSSSEQCCTGLVCAGNKCVAGESCKNGGQVCSVGADCCSGVCTSGMCLDASACNPVGGSCTPCCNSGLTCNAGVCETQSSSCATNGQACGVSVNVYCCGTLNCVSGTCQP